MTEKENTVIVSSETTEVENQNARLRDGAAKLLRTIGTIGLYLCVLLIPVAVIAAVVYTGYTLYTSIVHLGTETLVVNPAAAHLTAASMLATLALLIVAGVALSRTAKRRTLLIAGLFALVWLGVTFLLALVDSAISNGNIEVDDTLLRIGTFVYSALPAFPALPIAALAYSASHERDGQYQTLRAAAGAMGMTLLKAFGWVAMFSIESFFGIQIGVNPVAAIFSALLNATAFTSALGNIEASVHDRDRGGVRLWGLVSVFYAIVMFSIAAEAIIQFSGGASGGLSAMAPPAALEWFAQWMFVSSIGMSALLVAIALWRKARREMPTQPRGEQDAPKITIARPSMAHRAGMLAARPSILADEFRRGREAARGVPSTPALPAGTTMASEGDLFAGLSPEARQAAYRRIMQEVDARSTPKRAENGTVYDATAELIVPKDDPVLTTRREGYEFMSEWIPHNHPRINELGADGWELVSVGDNSKTTVGGGKYLGPTYLHSFKRPKA